MGCLFCYDQPLRIGVIGGGKGQARILQSSEEPHKDSPMTLQCDFIDDTCAGASDTVHTHLVRVPVFPALETCERLQFPQFYECGQGNNFPPVFLPTCLEVHFNTVIEVLGE